MAKKPKKNENWAEDPKHSRGERFSGEIIILRVYYNGGEGWAACRAEDKHGEKFGLVGNFGDDAQEGMRATVRGFWTTSKFGMQVKAESFLPIGVDDRLGFINFVASVMKSDQREKYGELANELWKKFGTRCIEVLTVDDISPLVAECKGMLGIPEYSLRRMISILSERFVIDRNKKLEQEFLAGLRKLVGSSPAAKKLFAAYGFQAENVLKAFPYDLALEGEGVDFRIADSVGSEEGFDQRDPIRIMAAVKFVLERGLEGGHCCLPIDDLRSQAIKGLSSISWNEIPIGELDGLVETAICQLEDRMTIVVEEDGSAYTYDMHEAECVVAKNIVVRNHSPQGRELSEGMVVDAAAVELAEIAQKVTYTDEQREAIKRALTRPVSVISGGPGTGKTTVCRGIINALEHLEMQVALCSPTGRGANRLSLATGRGAKTIHRLLEYKADLDEWEYGLEKQLLDYDAIIVDEASMVDIGLLRNLFDACPGAARMILVGDYDQLASVGPGRVLKDIIETGLVPTTRLSRIFRQRESSDIVGVSHQIRRGENPDIRDFSSEIHPGECLFVEADETGDVVREVRRVIRELTGKHGIDGESIQVLTPMRKGSLGVVDINKSLQAELNPPSQHNMGRTFGEAIFRVGDRVMQTKNDYDREIWNGDIGYVTKVDYVGLEVDFSLEGGPKVTYDWVPRDFLEHSYGLTIHKSQGSEFPVGIIIMHDSQSRMLQRNLLYTAVSRCKELAVIVGQRSAIQAAVENDREQRRNTALKARMMEYDSMLRGEMIG